MNKLLEFIKSVNTQYGDNSAIVIDENTKVKVDVIPTGISVVDKAFGIGGFPRGRISEVFGKEGCISEDTHINFWSLDENKKTINPKGGTIKRLYERFSGENTHHLEKKAHYFSVPSVKENGRVFHNIIHSVVKTGEKECFELTTKKGFSIEATKDHRFLTNNGFKQLEKLAVGDIVFVHNNSRKNRGRKKNYTKRDDICIKYHPKKRKRIITANDRRGNKIYGYPRYRLSKSHLVYEAHKNGFTTKRYQEILNIQEPKEIDKFWIVPDTHDIHHIDENRKNNTLNNLELIKKSDHYRYHANKTKDNLRFKIVEDKIKSIKPVGLKKTYDIKCYSPHNNYVADKIVVHNSGKTTLCLHAIANAHRMGLYAAFIDTEHSISFNRMKELGVDTSKLVFSQPNSGEEALNIVELMVRSENFGIIVVDSVAALTPLVEVEKDMGESVMGVHARLMSQAMRKLAAPVSKHNTALVFTNQTRSKIGVMWGNPEVTTGGVALKFYASLRIRMAYTGKIKNASGKQIAAKGKLTVVKNKLAVPFKEATFEINSIGIDEGVSFIESLIENGVLEKSGSWIKLNGKTIGQGVRSLSAKLKVDKELKKQIMELLHKHDS